MSVNNRSPLTNRFIDPAVLSGIGNLQLIAKAVVEGFVTGLHRSPFHGFSLDFAEYREYSPGDDIRRVDWKVFGRTDRFYVKKFEGDTNTQVYILLDTSGSMSFSSHSVTKLDYARYLVSALAYLAVRQSDAVSLITFDQKIQEYTPPRTRHGHFMTILNHLERVSTGKQTDITNTLRDLSRLIRKRSLVVLISDFYEDPEELTRALRFFHHQGNDVVLFHVLDPMELGLPLEGVSTLEDVETGEQLPFSSEQSREAYLDQLKGHIAHIRRECLNVHIDYEVLNTEKPLDRALYRYFTSRMRKV